MTDPQTIASKLTKAQRAAVMRAESDGDLGLRFVRWWHADARTLRALVKKDLGTSCWSGLFLTPSGELVRTHLEKESKK